MKTVNRRIEYLFLFLFFSFVVAGCKSSTPVRTTSSCSGQSARYNPTCHPTNWPPMTPSAGLSTPLATHPAESLSPPSPDVRSINVFLDDFSPQPYPEESVYFFNRLGGDRGAVNDSILDWGTGHITTTISSGNSWGGVWMSLNHPIRERLSINFSNILPPQILPAYQSQITGIKVAIYRWNARGSLQTRTQRAR